MEIGKLFNELRKEEYRSFIQNHKQYSDFNTLGLYRSLLENEWLSMEERIEIRDFAHTFFQKTFDFLQLKDPDTYMAVVALGEDLTEQEKHQLWEQVRGNQQKMLSEKRIKHRNFGIYAKHNCRVPYCPYDGLMVRQGSFITRNGMCFRTDENKDEKTGKAKRQQKEKRDFKQNKNRLVD